jgi:hypothetical protein
MSLAPSQVHLEIPEHISSMYPTLSPEQVEEFVSELGRDQGLFEKKVRDLHLEVYYDQIMSIVHGIEKGIEMTE